MLACEVAAHYKAWGMTLADALDDLYQRYGYMLGKQLTVELPGLDGKDAMARTMGRLRTSGLESVAGVAVERVIDYLSGAPMPVVAGESTQTLPPSDVLEWRLEGGSRILLRPSGTEPKLKAYVFAKGATADEAEERLDALCAGVAELIGGR